MERVELLAPAGDLERLKIAILYGADAVFCGGKQLSLRAKANNNTLDDLKEAVIFANSHNARVHVTVNVVPEDIDLDNLDKYLLELDAIGVHAIIVSSIYVMDRAKELGCHFEVHVSTQQSLANSKAIEFFTSNKLCNRAVLARETSIQDMKEIKEKIDTPIEAFIHGGMCSSYSGRCTLSNVMANRDANKGGCAHSCRWTYHLYQNENKIKGKDFFMASCDLMSLDYIKDMLDLGVNSFKIEGRMKSAYYIASVVSAYRQIIDRYYENGTITNVDIDHFKNEIAKAENRVTYSGFLGNNPKMEALLLETGKENPTQTFIGFVLTNKDKDGYQIVEVRNYFEKDYQAEAFMPSGKTICFKIKDFYDENGNLLTVANHPMDLVKFKFDTELPVNTFIRKI